MTILLEWVGFPTYVEKTPECDERRSCVEEAREVGDEVAAVAAGAAGSRGSEFGPNSVPGRVLAELGLAVPGFGQ